MWARPSIYRSRLTTNCFKHLTVCLLLILQRVLGKKGLRFVRVPNVLMACACRPVCWGYVTNWIYFHTSKGILGVKLLIFAIDKKRSSRNILQPYYIVDFLLRNVISPCIPLSPFGMLSFVIEGVSFTCVEDWSMCQVSPWHLPVPFVVRFVLKLVGVY